MKIIFYIILVSTILFSSCSSTRSLNSTIEDDIYFVPGSKPLMMQEVENITGQNIPLSSGYHQSSARHNRRNHDRLPDLPGSTTVSRIGRSQ